MCLVQPGNLQQARQFDSATCPLCIIPVGIILVMRCSRTFVNNRLASVCGDGITCGATTLGSSGTVFMENIPAHRLTNTNTCAGVTITASEDTYVGS